VHVSEEAQFRDPRLEIFLFAIRIRFAAKFESPNFEEPKRRLTKVHTKIRLLGVVAW